MKRMNKSAKVAALVLALTMAAGVLLAGCGNADNGNGTEPSASTQSSAANDNGAGQSAGSEDNSGNAVTETVKGYVFNYGNATVFMDADIAPILAILGEPKSYFEAASCAFEGLDKQYNYGSFEIDTYPDGDIDRVSSIYFFDDTVATAEGISVFATEDDLFKRYGTDYTEEGGELVYTKDGMKLCFIVEDGEVTSVCYRSTALEE